MEGNPGSGISELHVGNHLCIEYSWWCAMFAVCMHPTNAVQHTLQQCCRTARTANMHTAGHGMTRPDNHDGKVHPISTPGIVSKRLQWTCNLPDPLSGPMLLLCLDRQTDRQTDGQTDRQTTGLCKVGATPTCSLNSRDAGCMLGLCGVSSV
jgi:hypothetical protein